MSWPRSRIPTAGSKPENSNEESFNSLVALHYGFIWRVLRGLGLSRTDAEDATQQVFLIAARKLERIDPERARSFLYGAALRVANNARRGIRRRRETPSEPIDTALPEHLGPEHLTDLARARTLLAELLDQLPDKLRRALILAEIEQLEVQQIAALESIPVGTAASRLRLARKQFRSLLEATHHRNPFATEA